MLFSSRDSTPLSCQTTSHTPSGLAGPHSARALSHESGVQLGRSYREKAGQAKLPTVRSACDAEQVFGCWNRYDSPGLVQMDESVVVLVYTTDSSLFEWCDCITADGGYRLGEGLGGPVWTRVLADSILHGGG
jgi:hypothetical protein